MTAMVGRGPHADGALPDGEAANMEIALLLGLTGQQAHDAIRSRLPA
jgi:hypothetical protein